MHLQTPPDRVARVARSLAVSRGKPINNIHNIEHFHTYKKWKYLSKFKGERVKPVEVYLKKDLPDLFVERKILGDSKVCHSPKFK